MNRFLSALEKVGHIGKVVGTDAAKVAEVAAPIIAPIATDGLVSGSAVKAVESFLIPSTGDANVNPLEQFGIMMILGALQVTVKNPASKTAMQNQLLGLANDIYSEYGMTPPPQAVAAVSAKSA